MRLLTCVCEKSAELPELLLHCPERAGGDSASRGEVLNLCAQLADEADLEHLALVVNGLEVEQLAGLQVDVRPVADTATGTRPIPSGNPINTNWMRLSHT